MRDLTKLTREELLAIVEKQREYYRQYQRKPEAKAKGREYKRKRYALMKAGYEAAKKAGLI
jgi:hypothetical protein